MKRIVSSFCLVLFFAISLFAIEKPKILTPEEAFNVTTSRDTQGIRIAFTIAQGVNLYDDKIKIELLTPKSRDITSSLTRPPAESFHEYQTQRRSFEMLIPEPLLASQACGNLFTSSEVAGEGKYRGNCKTLCALTFASIQSGLAFTDPVDMAQGSKKFDLIQSQAVSK